MSSTQRFGDGADSRRRPHTIDSSRGSEKKQRQTHQPPKEGDPRQIFDLTWVRAFFLLSPSVNGQPPNVSSFSNSAGGLAECPDFSTVRMRDRDMRHEGLHSHVLAAFSFSKRSAIKKNKERRRET
jgi:hypothetical protein